MKKSYGKVNLKILLLLDETKLTTSMESKQFQMLLFEKITHQLDKRYSLVDHVTDLLQVSKDSAYRRIRGETAVSFDEALNLANHFGISLSEITGHSDNAAVFKKQPFIRSMEDYQLYMQSTLKQLATNTGK